MGHRHEGWFGWDHEERHAGGRHPRGGGPPGGGHPFGPPFGGFPRWFFGRGARARRGDVRAGILALLAEQPRNGYQIMQELQQRSGGAWRPSPGSVYPALAQLEDEGLVRAREDASGRLFELTAAGKKEAAQVGEAPWRTVGGDTGDELVDLLHQMKHIGAATMQILHGGDAAQIAEARKILGEARRKLYGMLAEDDDG
jgi:DNA-binding PadR family transcriptional regulator